MGQRILLFGDNLGIPQLLRHIPYENVCGLVVAKLRSHQHPELQALATKCNSPFIIQPRKTDPEYPLFVELIRKLNPDLMLVNSYSMIIEEEILSIPEWCCINIHGAILPEYRGANVLQWVIINDEPETGVTIHYMDRGLDTGDIIAQKRVPVSFEDTWQTLQQRVNRATDETLTDIMPDILSGRVKRIPQRNDSAGTWLRRHPEDGRIEWTWSVRRIYNMIRALVKPLPGAYCLTHSGKNIILDEFLSIPQVTKLKYSYNVGNQDLRTPLVTLDPINTENFSSQTLGLSENTRGVYMIVDPSLLGKKTTRNDQQSPNSRVCFAIYFSEMKLPAGICQLIDIDYLNGTANLEMIPVGTSSPENLRIFPDALHLIKEFAFNELALHRIVILLEATNDVTIRQYERIGFSKCPYPKNESNCQKNESEFIQMESAREIL